MHTIPRIVIATACAVAYLARRASLRNACVCYATLLASLVAPAAALRLEHVATVALEYPEFVEPSAVAIGPLGQLYVADLGRGTVMRIDSTAAVLFEFEAPQRQPDLQPLDLEVTGFKVYVLDAESNALLRYSEDGSFLDVLLSFAAERIETPRALSVDGIGRVLLANAARHSARIVDETQQTETAVGGFGTRPGELSDPTGVAFAPGGAFYVADTGNGRIQRFAGVGNLESIIAQEVREPRGLAVSASGELFVADARERAVHVFGATGGRIASLQLADLRPSDVCTRGNVLWVLSADPPALIQVRVLRGE